MDNRKNFLRYINAPIKKSDVILIYKVNNIKKERCELYSDFVQSLLRLTFDTYLGDDITDSDAQIKHFKWCWKKNKQNFKKEGLLFGDEVLFDYFMEFILEVYYVSVDKNDEMELEKNLLSIWYKIFDYNSRKSNYDIDSLIEIYNIFEKSMKIA